MLLSAVVSIIPPVFNLFNDTKRIQQQQQISRSFIYYIEESIRYSDDIIIINNSSDYPGYTSQYSNYSVICINNNNVVYDGATVNGRIYKKEKLSDSEKLAYGENGYFKFFYDIDIAVSGYNIITSIDVYNKDKYNNPTDVFSSSSTINLKNLELNSTPVTVIDASATITNPPGLTIRPAGKNTYILYNIN